MIFNEHSKLKGLHAFLGASKYTWLNYDGVDQLFNSYKRQYAAAVGTSLHEIASDHIRLGFKITKRDQRSILYELLKKGYSRNVIDMDSIFENLSNFVNDAIGFQMQTEQILYFSDNCFGTADAISFDDNFLRIHDYKSGTIPAHMEQLDIYSALFCLEYKKNPNEIQIEERIYQSNEVLYSNPDPSLIISIMDKIITFDKMIERFKKEGA